MTNAILIEVLYGVPGAFRRADLGQFSVLATDRHTELFHAPPFPVVQALVVEAALIVALTILICDVIHARIDPRVR